MLSFNNIQYFANICDTLYHFCHLKLLMLYEREDSLIINQVQAELIIITVELQINF